MPQRFLRPGITNSNLWNSVSWESQSLFIRLITIVDDYGRCDGRPSVLLGQLFSVWNEANPKKAVKLQYVTEMLTELRDAKLLQVYDYDGKTFIQISQWQERIREGTRPKFPDPQQVAASCSKLLPPTSSSPPTSPPSPLSGEPDVSPLELERLTQARVLIHHLNEKTGRHYQERGENLSTIACRLKEVSGDLEGIKQMVDRQCTLWKGDPKMEQYLRISTLFAPTNFHEYYSAKDLPAKPYANNSKASLDRNDNSNKGTSAQYANCGKIAKS